MHHTCIQDTHMKHATQHTHAHPKRRQEHNARGLRNKITYLSTQTHKHTQCQLHTHTHAHRHTLTLRHLTSFFPFLHREQMKRAAREEGRGREEGEEGTATAASDLRPVSNTRDAAQWSPSTQGVLTQPSSRPCAHCLS